MLRSRTLRPHQKIGVQFMFDCVMGLNGKTFNGRGCILADDMGLGKSIQAITILWTLLKQSPEGVPASKKALVVCPSSLVGVCAAVQYACVDSSRDLHGCGCGGWWLYVLQNWCAELKKWLGEGTIKPMPVGYVVLRVNTTLVRLADNRCSMILFESIVCVCVCVCVCVS
jgi:hypothetical protein